MVQENILVSNCQILFVPLFFIWYPFPPQYLFSIFLLVGLLAIIVLFIFAVLGVNLFADVPRGDAINDDANFDHFGMALLTLFRTSTGEAWAPLMEACYDNIYSSSRSVNGDMVQNSEGGEGREGVYGAGKMIARLYFMLFIRYMHIRAFVSLTCDACICT